MLSFCAPTYNGAEMNAAAMQFRYDLVGMGHSEKAQ